MNFKLITLKGTSNNSQFVTPAKAGVQYSQELMDSCFRRNDIFRGTLNPPVAKKTISKPGGGAGKALQRHPWKLATCVFRQNRGFTERKILRNPTFSKN